MNSANNLPTIGLSMIIKDEEKVILRCLNSIYPILDYFTIVDTGSTDSTKKIIKEFFESKKIVGEIYDHEWVNYEDARNFALNKAKDKADFSFSINASNELNIPKDFDMVKFRAELSQSDIGMIQANNRGMMYAMRSFWRNSKPFRYFGATHEVLLCDKPTVIKDVSLGLSVTIHSDGKTWEQGKEKFLKNIKLLSDYIDKNGLESRHVFYLAESYKDSGQPEKAIIWYENRTKISGGFYEEIYYSRLMVAKLKWQLGYPIMEIADELMRCGELDTMRAEHLYELKLMYERNSRPQGALKMAELLKQYKNPYPNRILFLNSDAYKNQEKKIIEMRAEAYLANGLNELIKTIKNIGDTSTITMVEIGSYTGESTVMFAKHFKKVIAVDCWQDGYDISLASDSAPMNEVEKMFDDRTKDFKNIVKIKNKSEDAVSLIKDEIQFIYIDGLHTYEQVKKDIANYLPLLKNGCFIGGHDFSDGWAGVKKAVIEMLGTPEWIFEDTSWLFKIKTEI